VVNFIDKFSDTVSGSISDKGSQKNTVTLPKIKTPNNNVLVMPAKKAAGQKLAAHSKGSARHINPERKRNYSLS